MADRSCAVMLVNNTPFPLKLRGLNLDHGNWDVLPPDRIESKGMGVWKSSSKSWALYGTQGQVDYLIDPESPTCLFEAEDALHRLMSVTCMEGIVHVDFESPYDGGPHCTTQILVGGDLSGGGNPDDYYWADDGRLMGSGEGDFMKELEEALEAGPVLESLLGWLSSPYHHPFFGCDVRLRPTVRLLDRGKPDSFMDVETPISRPMAFIPLSKGPASAWLGEWQYNLPDNSVDIKLNIQAGAEANTFSVELEDKTRFVSATYLNVPVTSSALIDYTGGERKEKPMERAENPTPIPGNLEFSGIGTMGAKMPTKPSIGGRFSKAEGRATTRQPMELSSTEWVDTLQLSDEVSLCLHALADLDDPTAIRTFLIQYVEKAGSEVISNTLLRPRANIR